MIFLRIVFCLLVMPALLLSSAYGAGQVELTTPEGTYVGKPLVHDRGLSWLAHSDGSYSRIELQKVTGARKYPDPFRAESSIAMRTRLQKELGHDYEVATRGQFVVAGPKGRAKKYAELLDKMARAFSLYASRRKLPTIRAEFPLLVQVFSKRSEFDAYCESDEVPPNGLIRGYYHPSTNRIALYERPSQTPKYRTVPTRRNSRSTDSELDPAMVQTLLHEGIHQLAFNSGLHSRIGANPRWVVEGFAEMMEGDGTFDEKQFRGEAALNPQRLHHFRAYLSQARQETISQFIADDEVYFRRKILNAYSQAWALSYFLAETRPSKYAAYLKIISTRDSLDREYSATERLSDFRKAFGNDIDWLEVQFVRFIEGL
ncbi:hypothetical protein KOR42_15760 [Thalassoglobus neptunius]|uniref:DUF1570 domain-containing protein n=1 Tax=Thalassoglobus neptunius TaxID=1938619 RepID=A0A5C5X7W6_9PLAN|nr:DUF1570 domain-containing protein [Thalassoglobus neptunius]TWT58205.1 hypothetical protein KOR42_15760 [Thalassoglobus neptunius]